MIKIACATDDGVNLIKRHFGDAQSYAIYELNNNKFNYVETISNSTVVGEDHDEEHGDAIKAKHVMMLLKMKNVDVLLNKAFGPNINRIKIRFLPIITRKQLIEDALEEITTKMEDVMNELEKGSNRKHLVMN